MLILQNISYAHPNQELLFDRIHLSIDAHEKIALVGNNGTGKSTLLKLIAGELHPSAGQCIVHTQPYYVPQHFGQFDHLSVAQVLRVDQKHKALQAILAGGNTEQNLHLLDNDWNIDERCMQALEEWQLQNISLDTMFATLSGGQKTKLFLAGILIHQPELVLLDEPSNHLDAAGRKLLYDFIASAKCALIVVSHDRKLLNLLPTTCELSPAGLAKYGGNYTFYAQQKQLENDALQHDIHAKEKALRQARDKKQEIMERQQRSDARGKKKQEKAGIAKIMMNTLRNHAENSTAKSKQVHSQKIGSIAEDLKSLRNSVPAIDTMQFGFEDASLHKNKILFTANAINVLFDEKPLWDTPLSFQVNSGERIWLKGMNGSGKTTLLKIFLNRLQPGTGVVYRAMEQSVYIDQEYSLINNALTVYEQAEHFNNSYLLVHEIKTRLNRFLFGKESWEKSCAVLSGGERMRLLLCCLSISSHAPDLIVLDEPTNNLDIQNIEILAAGIRAYNGTLLVVSHDEHFIEEVGIDRILSL